jgi:beta-fructofuranosidase
MVFHSEKRGLLDHGAYYAPKSQLDAKGRRILWGWIPETRPDAEFSAAGWAGCMSLPRVLSIDAAGGLKMSVIPEIAQLRGNEVSFSPATEGVDALRKIALKAACAEIEIRMVTKKLSLRLTDGNQDIFTVSYDPEKTGSEWEVNGRSAPLVALSAEGTRLRIFLDGSVVEAIADDSVALTTRVYNAPQGALHFETSDTHQFVLATMRIWEIRPISSDRLTT